MALRLRRSYGTGFLAILNAHDLLHVRPRLISVAKAAESQILAGLKDASGIRPPKDRPSGSVKACDPCGHLLLLTSQWYYKPIRHALKNISVHRYI
jgi:hypothetical protein